MWWFFDLEKKEGGGKARRINILSTSPNHQPGKYLTQPEFFLQRVTISVFRRVPREEEGLKVSLSNGYRLRDACMRVVCAHW